MLFFTYFGLYRVFYGHLTIFSTPQVKTSTSLPESIFFRMAVPVSTQLAIAVTITITPTTDCNNSNSSCVIPLPL